MITRIALLFLINLFFLLNTQSTIVTNSRIRFSAAITMISSSISRMGYSSAICRATLSRSTVLENQCILRINSVPLSSEVRHGVTMVGNLARPRSISMKASSSHGIHARSRLSANSNIRSSLSSMRRDESQTINSIGQPSILRRYRSTGRGVMMSSVTSSNSQVSDKSVRVVTYNVLSSHLGQPDYYRNCLPENLNASSRLNTLLTMLDSEIEKHSVICLQEVSMTWTGELHTYFSRKGYYFITALYGNRFNNYMGVGIAFPMSKYDIISTDIKRISDTLNIRGSRPEKKSELQKILASVKKLITSKIFRTKQPKLDPWNEALDRSNQMVVVSLKDKKYSKEFSVGTYHMPCMFQLPSVMMIHCSLSAKYMKQAAKGRPFIFCGDFNIKPSSSMYSLLTNGKVEPDHPECPPINPGLPDTWVVDVDPMTSAYKSFLGTEPEFTNNAQVRDEPVFIDTLDYIFLSKGDWNVVDVKSLPTMKEGLDMGPMPLATEPSDHLLLAATLDLQSQRK